ncbi:hexose transporter [Lophiostoma macrostomum CBS 122681]|uniref:Hexose transporter n=1 Tax=Lophiostoma macrostomum CBS 122681 TaxID=1314788 RepID=A0A6A6ST27_9PLEO|nr:hexose transporter [Lophiostoma macrostomum CBS 122681]
MSTHQRQYVSRWVPKTSRGLMGILLAVTVINSATLGYDSSVMNNLNILPSYTEYFNLNTRTTSLQTAAGWVGQMLGIFVMIPIADRYGRKMTIIVAGALCFIGTILQAASQNIGMFITARIIVGFGTIIGNAGAPTLVAELIPARTRGRMLGIFFSCYYVGSLISSIISYGSQNIPSTWSWRLPSLLMFIPSAITLCLYPLCPESPRYLISMGEFEHAREVLIVMQGEHTDVDKGQTELVEIRAIMHKEAEDAPRAPWIELFATKGNLKRLFVIVSFGTMIEMCGNFVISWYLTDILNQAGITDTTTQTQINVILNCWCFAVAIFGSYMLDVAGRRVQILFSLAGMAVMLYITGGLIKVYGTSTNTSGIYGTIAAIFIFQGLYSFAITPLTSAYPVEIASFRLRSTCVAIFKFTDCSFGLMASFVMNFAMERLSWKFYMLNASWDVLFFLTAYFFYPETKRLSLEAVATLFEGPQLIEAALEEDDMRKDDVFQGKGDVDVTAKAA